MSELHCPNCAHPIGTLVTYPGTPGQQPGPRVTLSGVEAVIDEWRQSNPWPGMRSAADLYADFIAHTGRNDVSKKAFGIALVRCGATRKRAPKARLYAY